VSSVVTGIAQAGDDHATLHGVVLDIFGREGEPGRFRRAFVERMPVHIHTAISSVEAKAFALRS
jgi:hypothetical protein